MGAVPDFESFVARKTREAARASIRGLVTIDDRSGRHSVETIGNAWTRQLYDGPFHLLGAATVPLKRHTTARLNPDSTRPLSGPIGSGFAPSGSLTSELPCISLVFVQSKDGNTGTDNPEELGGGATDKHLIYEGLSRVAADAVLAGATTAAGEDVFFSVWHPELVALRASLGLPRHPTQVVVTGRACINPDTALLFNVPDVPVIVVGSVYACGVLARAAASRRSMALVPMEGNDLRPALRRLRAAFGIQRISCIGGRTTATALLDAGLVQDICLTTTVRTAGEPETPFYAGQKPPAWEPIVRKRGMDPDGPILFEHLAVASPRTQDRLARR
jgi:riboflavin biosynthesis pyrimidine reductase